MNHTNTLPDPPDEPDFPFDGSEAVDLEDVSDESLELAAYLGTPEVTALCQHLSEKTGEDGKQIITAAFRDGFNAGASAFEEAMARVTFDHYVVLTEQSGCHRGHRISLRLTLLGGQLFCSEGFDHNLQQSFDTSQLGPDTMNYLFSIVAVHKADGRLPIPNPDQDAEETQQN